MRRGFRPLGLLLSLLWTSTAFAATGQSSAVRYAPDRVIVKFKPTAGASKSSDVLRDLQARSVHRFKLTNAELIQLDGISVEDAVARYRNDPAIEYIEPDYEVHALLTPNDPRFPELYGLRNTGQTGGTPGDDIHATNAWDVFTGDPNIKIGVIDTGVDYNHPDLAANIWTNPGEIPGNGIDDDGNGYVDDVHGYDFVNNDGDPLDDHGHGTHCSGTIAGVGNNGIGVTGVNWHAKIVGMKFLNSGGSGSTSNAIRAVDYAVVVGVRLTSNSWGGGGFSQALLDAINAAGAAGQLFVAAAGNSSQNTDVTPSYPASYNTPYIIAVAATDHNDDLASFSNYGATTVDLAAPGVNILSTLPGNSYGTLSGTSMACPHAAGAVGLTWGRYPALLNLQVKDLVLNSVDVKPSLQGRVLTNGRLNAFMAIAEPDSIPPGQITDLATSGASSNGMILNWTATGDDGNIGRAARYEIRYSTGLITEANFGSATLVPGPDPQPAGSPESWEVLGLDFNTTYYFAIRAFDEFNNQGPVSDVPTGTTLGIPDITASPTTFGTTLLSGATETQMLTLTNDGQGTLDFTVPAPNLLLGAPVTYEPMTLAKGETDTRPGVLGSGGPDAFGYRWVDSDDPGGPSYAWEDITGIGTPVSLTGDDATSSPINMGISFPFYGNTFTSVRVCTNGFLSFTDASTAYGNQPLPNSGAPANLVAPLWMDLNFPSSSQRAYAYSDGARFIVSWVDVPPLNGTGTATFQAILYPTGEIRYQYQSLTLAATGATVGIQNATKDIGLMVAFNTPYLHDNLAVKIAPVPQWLNVTPTSGRILAGQSMQLQVQFNALGLLGGTYNSNVVVRSNDPDESEVSLPAQLHVIGAPDIAVSPASLDFGQSFVGSSPTKNLIVSNPGTDDLIISDILSSDVTLSAAPTSFTLAPLAAQSVTVTYAPTSPAVLNATLSVLSNDPDQPTKVVTVVGSAVPAPDLSVTPASFDVTLQTNTATSRTLRIDNAGGSNLTWTAEPVTATASGTVTVYDVPDLGKDEIDSNPGIMGSGGPDVFGYSWVDSDDPGGPAFAWVDITGVGTPIYSGNADDSNRGPFPIGFGFPFYGDSFSTFRVSSNGFISFTSTSSDLSNAPLPGTGAPENLLAVFHDDMYVDADIPSQVYYYYDGAKLIVQFHNVRRYNQSDTSPPFYDMEAILYPNGSIVYQYQTVAASGNNSATIGIQNAARDDGLMVVYNADYVHDGLAIRIAPPARFLTVTPTSGTVPPGGFSNVMVGFNASGLFGGDYEGAVHLTTNDPLLSVMDVPSVLHVIGVPDITASPASLDFGDVFIGYPRILELGLSNIGTDDLVVTNITASNPAYGVDATSFTIPPLGNALLQVSFGPGSVGAFPAQLTIASNDPDSPNFTVDLAGSGIIPPDIAVTPTSMSSTLYIPDSEDQTLVVTNSGGSDLDFHMGAQLTATSVPVYEALELGKEEVDPRPGILGSGGPDMFGYRWVDSDEPGGPMFDWVDISNTPPVALNADDQNLQGVAIGFDFPFYGNTFSTVNLCSNGWLSFTSTSTSLSNNPLPSSGSPENLLAAFWDDLDFRSTSGNGRAYAHNDGSRFIVSYIDVPRYSSHEPYTFQVILYPSGKIVYQYLDMQGTRLNEATIGIQNATKDDGLTVVYNANYVHNGLAVEIRTTPDWMTMNPDQGIIPAGGSMNIQVHIDTNGLFGGLHEGSIQIASNDPDESVVSVPMTLTAIGTPDLATAPTSLDFGDVYVGLSNDLDIQVANVGSDVLTISGASIDNGAYALVGATFPIVLGERGQATLTVRFTPTGECIPCTGTLAFASNDPSSPLDVPLTGNGIIPPEIEVSPTSLKAALATTLGPTAISKTKTLTVCNTGGSDLNFSLNAAEVLNAASSYEFLDLAKDAVDPRPGILGTGGPDAFGYTWTDSDEPGGPTYDWVEISDVGTPTFGAYSDDGNRGPFDIGFTFSFYGNDFTQFRVCSNGWLSFSSTSTKYTNQPLPNSGAPENLLAAFWDDMVVDPSYNNGEIYYYNDGTRLIVQYDVRRIATYTPPFYSFEIILYPNGDIVYQYRTLGATVNSATIGIQNDAKDDGLMAVFNDAYVHDNMAIRFASRPAWLTVDPTSGTIPAGECMTLNVTFDATGLEDGDYQGMITIASNDLTDPTVDVPCDLHVGVMTASLDVDPASLNPKSNGNWVKCLMELPAGHDPYAILIPSILLQRTVPVDPNASVSYTDLDGDLLEEANYKCDRASLLSVLPSGDMVTIEAIGEEEDVTWFVASDVIRVLKPRVNATRTKASADDSKTAWIVPAGSNFQLSWQDPEEAPVASYQLWLSSDAGQTWSLVAKDMTGHDYSWSVPEQETDKAILELAAYDALGFMGSWVSETFTIGKGGVIDRLPTTFGIRMAGPNPARSAALFSLAVPHEGAVNVNVYDVKGALVRQLVRTAMAPGLHALTWDGHDSSGHLVASGVYFVHLNAGGKQQTVRVLLMR